MNRVHYLEAAVMKEVKLLLEGTDIEQINPRYIGNVTVDFRQTGAISDICEAVHRYCTFAMTQN
jgi:hypothetical protein